MNRDREWPEDEEQVGLIHLSLGVIQDRSIHLLKKEQNETT